MPACASVKAMPRILGVVETVLYVEDLDRAATFYHEVLDLEPLAGDERSCVFHAGGCSVLLLFLRGASLQSTRLAGGRIPPHDGLGPAHLGFGVSDEDLPAWEETLERHGVTIESRVAWATGSRSTYFRDPDGHLLELLTPGLWPCY